MIPFTLLRQQAFMDIVTYWIKALRTRQEYKFLLNGK